MVEFSQIDELKFISVSNKIAVAKIALQGAHIFEYQVKGSDPLLWLSKSSNFKKSKAIRGGIPICWPWFGEHKTDKTLPNHGFARITTWDYISTQELNDEVSVVTLILKSSKDSLTLFPYLFELTLEIVISNKLKVSLKTKNVDTKPFRISQALHSYLLIDDIENVSVDGLDNKEYYNKVDNSYNNTQTDKLSFTQETDRIYQNITTPLTLTQKNREITIFSEGSESVVIWNPWRELAHKMSDLSSYSDFLCIESANVLQDERKIEPNETHTLSAIFTQG